MFAPNILAVENKRVVLGEACHKLSLAFAEVRPPSVPFSSSLGLLLIILSAFSLFLFSFCTLFFSPFHPSRSLWAHICAHPLVILLSAFSLLFSLSFSFCTLFFLLFILPVPFGRIFAPTR